MKPTVNIPREKLAELLQASGSTLTPEEYAAALPGPVAFVKFPGRARVAAWSKNFLIFFLVLSAVAALMDFGIEGVLVVVALGTVTYFETRVHRYFSENNPEAPTLGYRNQCGFAAGLLAYCLYHAFSPGQIPDAYKELLPDPSMFSLLLSLVRTSYLIIGIVGGISQFGLAWYYRSAQVREPVS